MLYIFLCDFFLMEAFFFSLPKERFAKHEKSLTFEYK